MNLTSLTICIACCASIAASPLLAQNFNVDIGANVAFPTPPPAYAGALGQPGYWNPVPSPVVGFVLRDLMNLTTLARLSVAGGNGNFEQNHPGTFGGDEALLDDLQDVGSGAAGAIWTFSNLQDGLYDVVTYAWAPDDAAYVSRVDPTCGSEAPQLVSGPWPGVNVRGVTYARHRARTIGGAFSIRVTPAGAPASVNGFQIRKLPVEGIPGCFGDGTDFPCPCGNFGDPGRGCENSFGTGGGLLEGFGIADVSADQLVLVASHLPPAVTTLFYQGTAPIGGGGGVFGAPFGDGLRCVGGTVIRLAEKTSECGVASYPDFLDDSISDKGVIPAAGGVRFYQAWYRNAAAFCTVDTFNLTNGYQVTWAP